MTYGAGGSSRDRTEETVNQLFEHGVNAVPHLSWGAVPRSVIIEQIEGYRDLGVKAFVLLRGDIGTEIDKSNVHHATDLVHLVREEFPDRFDVFVAAYPEVHPDAASPSRDIGYLKEKVLAGATACFTQYFFNADAYFYFVDQCHKRGIDVPIIPGIMPIANYDGLVTFSERCGAEIPRWIERKLFELQDDTTALEEFGRDVVTSLCDRLVSNGCPGLHFYTLNKSRPTMQILKLLNLPE